MPGRSGTSRSGEPMGQDGIDHLDALGFIVLDDGEVGAERLEPQLAQPARESTHEQSLVDGGQMNSDLSSMKA